MMVENAPARTVSEWREFMDGYRDPITAAEDHKQISDFKEEFDDFDSFGNGLNNRGGARECGFRKEGGTYAVCPQGKDGKPIEHFVACHPIPIDKQEYGLANIGVKLIDVSEACLDCNGKGRAMLSCASCNQTGKQTVTHVFDIVGRDNYPNVADFLEEARALGVSRRLELEDANQYARLSKRSRLLLLHERAVLLNPHELLIKFGAIELLRFARAGCPAGREHHGFSHSNTGNGTPVHHSRLADAPGCASFYWHVLEGATPVKENFVERELQSRKFRGYELPKGFQPNFGLGIFAVFPLMQIEVVNGSGAHSAKVERARRARIDVLETDC